MQTKEEYYGIFTENQIVNDIQNNHLVCFKGKRPVLIGKGALLKVCLNVGVSAIENYDIEIEKLSEISSLPYRPDAMMDHTNIPLPKPLWKTMVESFDGAVGTLPHYVPFDPTTGIREEDLMDNILEMAKGGVSFMTLHPTAELDIYKRAEESNRIIPTTSRGGYVLLKDQAINNRKENLIAKNFEKIMKIFKEYEVGVSIGTVFRPATIHEALDEFHIEETVLQKKYIDIARNSGVPVIMEGIGHISLDRIPEYANLIRPYDTPLMVLGPMLSDEIIGFDHITNALGGLSIAQTGVAGMIHSVTREEHTGKVPSKESIIEGLKAARVAAHCYNISQFPQYKNATEVIGVTRAKSMSCVQRGGIFQYDSVDDRESLSCTRCRRECPLQKITY